MGSDFSEFISQPFISGMLGMLGLVFLLLVATIAALVYVRRRKAQQKLAADIPPSFVTAISSSPNDHDMPDLNLLVHNAAPPPSPAPAVVAQTPVAAPPPAPIRSARKGTFTVLPKDGSSTEAVEVLTILRDVVDGKLLVQMGESTYNNVNANAEFKERFNKLMREVGQMVTKPVATVVPTASETEPEPESSPEPLEPEALPKISDLMQANEPTFLAPKKPASATSYAPSGTLPGDLPSFKLEDNPMQKLKRGQKANLPPVPEINIAGAIEAYLQHKLNITPEYAGHSIHIYPAPGGGVSIEVDGKYFEAVSDVSDPAVREFLSDTITEWQERH